jgi:prevent-host-death family protein
MKVAIRTLKAELSAYLELARQGEVIQVTSHNQLVAQITGVQESSPQSMNALLFSKQATWSGKKPIFDAPEKLNSDQKSMSDLVLELRN